MNIKKLFLWYWMLTKRLFHKFSFVILLCCIPIMVLITNTAMTGESGVLTILLYAEDEDSGAEDVINSLLEGESVILFKRAETLDSALNEVKQHRADAVWCFENNFDERVENYASHSSEEPLVTVYEREDTVPLQLSGEKLFGSVYNTLSNKIYKNFVYTKIIDANHVSEEELQDYYRRTAIGDDIVELEKENSGANDAVSNYLMMPLRGILSLLVVLCGLAAAMYFLKDKADGKFDWMPSEKRIIPAFAQCLSATVPAAVSVLIAVCVTGISVEIIHEIVSMGLFVVSSVGFCLLMCTVFPSSGKLGAAIPAILIAMLALSPVFFNMQMLRPLSIMLPTYHYLNSVYNAEYYLYTVVYILCVYGISLMLTYKKVF